MSEIATGASHKRKLSEVDGGLLDGTAAAAAALDAGGKAAANASASAGVQAYCRIEVSRAVLERGRKHQSDLPETAEQIPAPRSKASYWCDYVSNTYHPIVIADSQGNACRPGSAAGNPAIRMVQTITWTAPSGVVQDMEVVASADKEGVFWFRKVDAYVAGSFTLTFACPTAPACTPLVHYIHIIPSSQEESSSASGPAAPTIATGGQPYLVAADVLERSSSMVMNAAPVTVRFGARELLLPPALWAAVRDDHSDSRARVRQGGEGGLEVRRFSMPPMRPSVSDVLRAAAQREGGALEGHKADAEVFVECMRACFDDLLLNDAASMSGGGGSSKGKGGSNSNSSDSAPSLLLYDDEAAFFGRAGLLNQFRSGGLRPCDALGRIYVLRFIVALGVMLTHEPPQGSAASSSDTPINQRSSRRSSGGGQTTSNNSTSTSSRGGGDGAMAAWNYLRGETVHAAVGDVLRELEGAYPLLVQPPASY